MPDATLVLGSGRGSDVAVSGVHLPGVLGDAVGLVLGGKRRHSVIPVRDVRGVSLESVGRAARLRSIAYRRGSEVTLVGTAGFEPATSASRTLRATKLRHVPRPLV